MSEVKDEEIVEAFKKLRYMEKILDCSYPGEALARKIGFNKFDHNGVSVSIVADYSFAFELSVPYESSDFEYISFNEINEYVDFSLNIGD